MREAQREYFKTREKRWLDIAKDYEKRVDHDLENLPEEYRQLEESLFPEQIPEKDFEFGTDNPPVNDIDKAIGEPFPDLF